MSIQVRVRKLFFWLGVVSLAGLAAVVGFAYSYVTDSATLAALIRQEAPRFFPGSILYVGRVQMRPFIGEAALSQVGLWQKLDGKYVSVVRIPWLNIKSDLEGVIQGKIPPREIVVAQPTLRVRRGQDGNWNLSSLLADPWPGPSLSVLPVIIIRSGRVELMDDRGETKSVLLRDVAVRIEPAATETMHFEGSAQGDAAFGRVRLEGTYDRTTGRLDFTKGDLTRLAVTETISRRLPPELKAKLGHAGLSGGEIDVTLKSLRYDPTAPNPLTHYAATVELRDGIWNCPIYLPFPLNEVEAVAFIEDGHVNVEHAQGRNGKTVVRARGSLSADDPVDGPFNVTLEVIGLELDERLKAKTPPKYLPLWREFQPSGRVNLAVRVVREKSGGTPAFGMTVSCQDVAMNYFKFPYALEHVRGTLVWTGPMITVDLETVPQGGDLLTAKGTIRDPGPRSIVDLEFRSEAMPINKTFMDALPKDVLPVVQQFNPAGSVRGSASLHRTPPPENGGRETIEIAAKLDLNEGCSMRWDGLPYPIIDLTGHLEIFPRKWIFRDMKGRNGTAQIEAEGHVDEVAPKVQRVDLSLRARHLPFDDQLHDALPREWQVSWDTLKPTGSSNVAARIRVEPRQAPHYHLEIAPEPDSRVRLTITPVAVGSQRSVFSRGTIELPPMENIHGAFVFDNGTVNMSQVTFVFREAPVRFRTGTVVVQDNGQFDLKVFDLEVSNLRLDSHLRRIMPPVMSQFAQKLDDGKPFSLHTNLRIAWSGEQGKPAWCSWDHALVVFDSNTILSGLPLRDIQGQIEYVRGWSDGQNLQLAGALKLQSVYLLGQQVTALSSPLEVKNGWARLTDIQGRLLGGNVRGNAEVSLDASPEYHARLRIEQADLREYAQSMPGHQRLRGLVSGWLNLNGMGNSLGTLSGEGGAKMTDGDLGQLPFLLRWVKVPNFSRPTKTAFNAAELGLKIQNGIVLFDTIKFTGDAFSLQGSGTLDLAGDQELDLHLSPLYGRDDLHVPLLSDVMREVTGRFFDIHVSGPAPAPTVRPEPLPSVLPPLGDAFRRRAEGEGREMR
jgi:hypothetical protein